MHVEFAKLNRAGAFPALPWANPVPQEEFCPAAPTAGHFSNAHQSLSG